ncbi:MAG: PadR family transcriptional regulator [Planctomycetes bacterium]|nr:PadR family transcriptional regulator [Planctomycetota bacterium]
MDSRLLWGTVDMLILDVVSRGPTYGYQIAQSVLSQSKGYFELKEGSLYPALHRMERQKLLRSYWVDTDEGRRRKFYELTPAGRRALKDKREEWERFAAGVSGVLGASLGLA